MSAEKISLDSWLESYYEPWDVSDEEQDNTIDPTCADGGVLDALIALADVEGEDATDSELLELAHELLNRWLSWSKRQRVTES